MRFTLPIVAGAAAAVLSAPAEGLFVPAGDSSRVKTLGRMLPLSGQQLAFDWAGSRFSFVVANATYVNAVIQVRKEGGGGLVQSPLQHEGVILLCPCSMLSQHRFPRSSTHWWRGLCSGCPAWSKSLLCTLPSPWIHITLAFDLTPPRQPVATPPLPHDRTIPTLALA